MSDLPSAMEQAIFAQMAEIERLKAENEALGHALARLLQMFYPPEKDSAREQAQRALRGMK